MTEPEESKIERWLRSVQDALNRPLDGPSAPEWMRSSRTWQALNRPLFGTQPRAKPVWIEGRLSRRQQVAWLLFAVAVALLVRFALPALDPRGWLCLPGLGGYSLGGEMAIALLLLILLAGPCFCVYMFFKGWRLRKRQRNIPLGYRPWFRTQLIEGRAAVRAGTTGMIVAVVCLALLVYSGTGIWPLFQKLLVTPAEIKKCNVPGAVDTGASEFAVPAAGKS